jgi:hypothetical protein
MKTYSSIPFKFPCRSTHFLLRKTFLSAYYKGNRETLSHSTTGNPEGWTEAVAFVFRHFLRWLAGSQAVNNQNTVTRVTSTRVSSIAKMIDLSREMPMALFGSTKWGICHQEDRLFKQAAIGASAPGFGMMFFASPLFAENAAGQLKGKERVQL